MKVNIRFQVGKAVLYVHKRLTGRTRVGGEGVGSVWPLMSWKRNNARKSLPSGGVRNVSYVIHKTCFIKIYLTHIHTVHTVSLKGLVHHLNDVLSNSAVLCTIKKKFKKPILIIFNPSSCTVRVGEMLSWPTAPAL